MIEVLAAGPLTSVQDPFGRPAWRHLGVPVGGAADGWSARLANRLVGNDDGLAVLEVTLGGAALRVESNAFVALTGGVTVWIDDAPAPLETGLPVRSGSTVRIESGMGARGYVAISGGIRVEPVLGSHSTDLRGGFGGFEGRALRDGDRLPTGPGPGVARRWIGRRDDGPLRVVDGPFADASELEREWVVGPEADRTGVRLDGPRLRRRGEIASVALPLGAIQVPPDGRPIVMLADRPVTGGYQVVGCLIRADVGRVAQLRPGDRFSFARVSMAQARDALRVAEQQLAALEALDAPEDDELGWIGSLE